MKQISKNHNHGNNRNRQKSRGRSSGGGGGGGGGGGNNLNRVYESAGPEGKVRGTAQQIIDKYTALANDSLTAGDRITAESFFQHAEHFQRIVSVAMAAEAEAREQRALQQQQRDEREREQREQREANRAASDDRQNNRGDRERYNSDRQRPERQNAEHQNADRQVTDETPSEERPQEAETVADGGINGVRQSPADIKDDSARPNPLAGDPRPGTEPEAPAEEVAPAPKKRASRARKPKVEDTPATPEIVASDDGMAEEAPKPKRGRPRKKPVVVEAVADTGTEASGDADAAS